jgi:hypothetical protein
MEPASAQAPSQPSLGPEGIASPSQAVSPEVFANLNILIRPNTSPSPNASLSSEEMISCRISVSMTSLPEPIEYTLDVPRVEVEAVKNNAFHLLRFQYSDGGTRALAGGSPVYREPGVMQRKKRLLSSMMKDIGTELGRIFFTRESTEFMIKALNSHAKVRFVFTIEVPEFWTLPWECLYISALKLPVGLVSKHSLVRYSPNAKPASLLSPSWGSQVRILVVFSAPTDVPHLKLEEEEKVLKEIFAKVEWADLRTIPHVTIDEFAAQMRTFNPDIIQFSGHGGLNPDTGEGALIFENASRTSHWIHASQFSTWCRDQDVRLVILNACDTGTPVANDVVTSVAGALIEAGIPAAVATTRAIDDIQSIMFVREFYRALVDGYTVESAMAEARKRVNSENWDWSAFALFVSTLDLDRYRLALDRI